LDVVIEKVIAGLRHHLAHPAIIETFISTYNAERRKLAQDASRERPALERRLSAIDREITNLVDALKGGGGAVPAIVSSIQGLEGEKSKVEAELSASSASNNVVAIHPKAVERYQRALAELADEWNKASPEEIAVIRSLIKSVTVHTDPNDGSVSVDISGRIAALASYCICGSVIGSGHPAFRAPSVFFKRVKDMQSSGECRRENVGACLRLLPRRWAIEYAAAYRLEQHRLWNTGLSAGACHRARRRRDPVADDDLC
jgi:hypothetical protein